MAGEITPLIVGNWKMNGLTAALGEFTALGQLLSTAAVSRALVAICPPATLLAAMSAQGAQSGIVTGGQDCHSAQSGAHTGDISASMLADAGAQFVILGHSERRADHGESDALVRAKVLAALSAGLRPIVCVGERQEEREGGQAESVVQGQLAGSLPDHAECQRLVIAYEPVWAIGTGLTPTLQDIVAMHETIRRELVGRFGAAGRVVPILYGGSVKPGNARDILALGEVNGALVGGASLLANDFFAIISAA